VIRTVYLDTLAVALLQAGLFVLGVFLIDSILRIPKGIRRALSYRSYPRVRVEPARDTTRVGFDRAVDMLLKAELQAEPDLHGAGHKYDERRRRLNDYRDH